MPQAAERHSTSEHRPSGEPSPGATTPGRRRRVTDPRPAAKNPDERLLTVFGQWSVLHETMIGPDKGRSNDEERRLAKQLRSREITIARFPAHTLAGAVAKLRVLDFCLLDDQVPWHHKELLQTAVIGLKRLAESPERRSSIEDDPVLKITEHLQAYYDKDEGVGDFKDTYEQRAALTLGKATKMLASTVEPTSLDGVVALLTMAAGYMGWEDLLSDDGKLAVDEVQLREAGEMLYRVLDNVIISLCRKGAALPTWANYCLRTPVLQKCRAVRRSTADVGSSNHVANFKRVATKIRNRRRKRP